MGGFVQVFVDNRARELAVHRKVEGQDTEGLPMFYYGRDALPAYRHLVDHHTVCQRWHAAVPAGTWPNRMYFYAGTSGGLFGNGEVGHPNDEYHAKMPRRLLVDELTDAGISWRVYTHTVSGRPFPSPRIERANTLASLLSVSNPLPPPPPIPTEDLSRRARSIPRQFHPDDEDGGIRAFAASLRRAGA